MSAKYGDNKYHKNAVTDMFDDYREDKSSSKEDKDLMEKYKMDPAKEEKKTSKKQKPKVEEEPEKNEETKEVEEELTDEEVEDLYRKYKMDIPTEGRRRQESSYLFFIIYICYNIYRGERNEEEDNS